MVTVSTQTTEMVPAGAVGLMAAYWVVIILCVVLFIVAWWKIFKKAGFAGWKSIIPFYNQYCLFRISGMSGWWIFLPIVASIFITAGAPATIVGNTVTYDINPLIIIGGILTFATSIVEIVQLVKLAAAFKKGLCFKICSVLFPNITCLILAFGKAKYNKKYLHD